MTLQNNSKNTRHLGNVLAVDDEPSIVRLIDYILENQFGDTINRFTAFDANEAQTIIKENVIDLVITDLELGGPNGFQLLQWLKGWEPLIQVIVLTGHDTQDSLRTAFSHGANDFLAKPLDRLALIRSAEFLLQRMQRWQPLLLNVTPDGNLFGVSPLCNS